jgi:hypothetical protein
LRFLLTECRHAPSGSFFLFLSSMY